MEPSSPESKLTFWNLTIYSDILLDQTLQDILLFTDLDFETKVDLHTDSVIIHHMILQIS